MPPRARAQCHGDTATRGHGSWCHHCSVAIDSPTVATLGSSSSWRLLELKSTARDSSVCLAMDRKRNADLERCPSDRRQPSLGANPLLEPVSRLCNANKTMNRKTRRAALTITVPRFSTSTVTAQLQCCFIRPPAVPSYNIPTARQRKARPCDPGKACTRSLPTQRPRQ